MDACFWCCSSAFKCGVRHSMGLSKLSAVHMDSAKKEKHKFEIWNSVCYDLHGHSVMSSSLDYIDQEGKMWRLFFKV